MEHVAATAAQPPEDVRLEQLNQFTRRVHQADEVFLFDVRLCDNEIDRDCERFSLKALEELQTLFVGRTGIFDHNPRGENQTARIFATELVQEPTRETSAGEVYTYLKGHAYMVRTDANRDLIREIDGGIKKEVSISCSANRQTCSICGSDRRKNPCAHQPGHTYGDAFCHTVLSEIRDAYEWSFVAIPAQREAGVTKQFGKGDTEQVQFLEKQLRTREAQLHQMEELLRQDIVRLRFLVEGASAQDAISTAVKRMDLAELMEFRETLRKQQNRPFTAQLEQSEHSSNGNTAFRI